MKNNRRKKITYVLQTINIVPLIIFGFAIMVIGTHWFTQTMYTEIENELRYVAKNFEHLLDTAYPGDYHLEGKTAYQLFKGSANITGDYSIIDKVKEDTGLDLTLFYQDTRILTTIYNKNGVRIIGSGAPDIVINNVLATGEEHFYHKAFVNSQGYYAYYMPLSNSDGTVVGMIFVGKPSEDVEKSIQTSVYPLIYADIFAMLLISVCTLLYTKSIISALIKIRSFLSEVSEGNLNTELDKSVLRRADELGDIGRSALAMQRSLRTMVETDTLTELYNRRSGDRKLKQVIRKSQNTGTDFCVCIADIDFFKRVNDTYGHDCGDFVLKTIADKLKEHMRAYGFVARWGGEEFLIVFDHTNLDDSINILGNILDDIRNTEIEYDAQLIHVTMTFGITAGETDDIKQLIRLADEKLYAGKSMGRNRIIS